MNQKDVPVLVIGAGPAGLATSACLRREGVAHLVVDKADSVASAWRQHYDRLHLHTVKRFSTLPHSRWDDSVPSYPSRAQVVDYLEGYAREHDVQPRLGVEVQRITRRGDHALVRTSDGEYTPKAVVVATGSNRVPVVPAWPGAQGFGGLAMHSSAYRNPEPFAGKRTLVVGCGNSGAEIALDLAEHGVDVSMVVRGPVHVVPRDVFGITPAQQTSILMAPLPRGLRDMLVSATMRLAVGDLSKWGIVRPKQGLNAMIDEQGRIPMLDVGTVALIKKGRIRVAPGVRAVEPNGIVVFDDASKRAFDAMVFATGFTTGLNELIDDFDAIADGRGRPNRCGEESAIPGLYFVGYDIPSTGALRQMSIEAPKVARQIRTKLGGGRAA